MTFEEYGKLPLQEMIDAPMTVHTEDGIEIMKGYTIPVEELQRVLPEMDWKCPMDSDKVYWEWQSYVKHKDKFTAFRKAWKNKSEDWFVCDQCLSLHPRSKFVHPEKTRKDGSPILQKTCKFCREFVKRYQCRDCKEEKLGMDFMHNKKGVRQTRCKICQAKA